DETPLAGEDRAAFLNRAARDKGMEVASRVSQSVVLSADTVVTIDNEILGKPEDDRYAERMRCMLSYREKWPYTAVAVVNQSRQDTLDGIDEPRVPFKHTTGDEIGDDNEHQRVVETPGALKTQCWNDVIAPRHRPHRAGIRVERTSHSHALRDPGSISTG